jgi:hypothetical protein
LKISLNLSQYFCCSCTMSEKSHIHGTVRRLLPGAPMYYAYRRPLPGALMRYAFGGGPYQELLCIMLAGGPFRDFICSKCIKKMSQEIHQNMIFSPKNKLFTKENFVQINPQEYGNFSRKCNLHKVKFSAKCLVNQ